MKKILFGILISASAFGYVSKKVTATSGVPIPTSYDHTSTASLVMGPIARHKNALVNNTSASGVACILNAPSGVTEPTTDLAATVASEEIYIPAASQVTLLSGSLGPWVYCRSDTGSTITSGSLIVEGW